jgi:phosphoribosylformylglycinamidine (FGAM) synthase-like enzyme
VIGCVGLVQDVRTIPSRWRSGDLVLVAEAPADLDLAAEAALVQFLWQSAPLLSLAHDVSDGGLALALEEAAAWSGREVRIEGELAEPRAGAAIVACAPEHLAEIEAQFVKRIGVVV